MEKGSSEREAKKLKTSKDDTKDIAGTKNDTLCPYCEKSAEDVQYPPAHSSLLPYQECPHCDFVIYLEPDPNQTEEGDFGYVLTDLCFGRCWDRALQRVKIYPKETELISDSYEAETALHWAACYSAPPELIKALARANAKDLGRGSTWGDDGANPLMLLFRSFESLEDQVELMMDLIPLYPVSVLSMDGECGNACLLDYAWIRIEKEVREILGKHGDDDSILISHDLSLKWKLFTFMVEQACGVGPAGGGSLIAALAGMDNSLVIGDCAPCGPPPEVLRFAILVAGKENTKEQLSQTDDQGNVLLHKIAINTKRPPRKWQDVWNECEGYWLDDYPEFATEVEYLDWKMGQYKAEHLIMLLNSCPEASQVSNKEGMLPLHLAIKGGRGWSKGGVKELYEACPETIKVPYKGMLPFLLAAETCKTTLGDDIEEAILLASFIDEYDTDDYDSDGELKEGAPPREDWTHWKDEQLDVTYELLRSWPEALKHQLHQVG